MVYETLAEREITNFGVVLVYLNDISNGLFINMLLTVIFLIILVGLIMVQIRKTGFADFPLSLAVASFVTSILTVILNLIDGLVSPTTNTIVVAITLLSVLFFMFSRK